MPSNLDLNSLLNYSETPKPSQDIKEHFRGGGGRGGRGGGSGGFRDRGGFRGEFGEGRIYDDGRYFNGDFYDDDGIDYPVTEVPILQEIEPFRGGSGGGLRGGGGGLRGGGSGLRSGGGLRSGRSGLDIERSNISQIAGNPRSSSRRSSSSSSSLASTTAAATVAAAAATGRLTNVNPGQVSISDSRRGSRSSGINPQRWSKSWGNNWSKGWKNYYGNYGQKYNNWRNTYYGNRNWRYNPGYWDGGNWYDGNWFWYPYAPFSQYLYWNYLSGNSPYYTVELPYENDNNIAPTINEDTNAQDFNKFLLDEYTKLKIRLNELEAMKGTEAEQKQQLKDITEEEIEKILELLKSSITEEKESFQNMNNNKNKNFGLIIFVIIIILLFLTRK